MHKVDDPQAMIERAMDTLERFAGKRPVGWLGPGLTQTLETPDLLAAAGVKYIGDFPYDDEPTEIHTAHGPLVTLPYSVETNDIPVLMIQIHESGYWTRKCVDTFDRYYQEAAERPKIMAIAIHPYISGQPSRIGALEKIYEHINRHSGVLHWNGEQILDWYQQARPATQLRTAPME
jgi:peptidoglycan/xylan/chitin deacetylase (PgdA/CDA1 family)